MASPADPTIPSDGPPPEVAARAAGTEKESLLGFAEQLGANLPSTPELAGGRAKVVAAGLVGLVAFTAAGLAGPLDVRLLPAVGAMGLVSGVAFWIDLRHRVIPNAVNLVGVVAVPLLVVVAALLGAPGSVVGAFLGGFSALLIYGIQALLLPKAMGMGDAKLAPTLFTIAGFLGYVPWRNTILFISVLGALVSLALLVAKKVGRKAKVAYGPSMVIGALVALLVG